MYQHDESARDATLWMMFDAVTINHLLLLMLVRRQRGSFRTHSQLWIGRYIVRNPVGVYFGCVAVMYHVHFSTLSLGASRHVTLSTPRFTPQKFVSRVM